MAFFALIPLVEVLAEGAETAIVAAEAAEATAAASEAAAASAEAAAAEEAAAAAEETAAAEAELGEGTASTASQVAGRTVLQSAIAFTKWLAKQAVELALFEAGMRAIEAAINALTPENPDRAEMQRLIRKMHTAIPKLQKAVNGWLSWSRHHFDNRTSFGVIEVWGTPILRFDVLQNKLAALSDIRHKKLVPLSKGANISKTKSSLQTLMTAVEGYANGVTKVNDFVRSACQAMVAYGLEDYQADIESALSDLK
ncbi:hypothetical protein J3459_014766 [Metarhizium acridum]|uniref:Uncharacterized protein n=1 Tax=Metarhizium acridum (strain CQMa 102) TaxID=655827 RepID=E9E3R6_METAQ|nr:uncharacterized protein MAC_04510 [Metarhizium acridum CQMa 102]EFY89491.1 hypothetical protein MAC_04510 [Metarhizium acridum CQMa 102]KAG8412172.1 hypothetical protein J3458_014365 [Metarhizium acridum]KAG8414425.1 hypothetical protein J3459_014766 [Metarhizium acridum]